MKNDLSEHFEKQLERTNTWLSFAEAKNAALIAFNVSMIAVISDVLSDYMVLLVILVILLLISTIVALVSFMPETKNVSSNEKDAQEDNNLLFFGDIAKCNDRTDYIEKTKKRYFLPIDPEKENENINSDLASEILINSRLTVKKYNLFKLALMIDFLCLALTAAFFIIA